MKAKTFELFGAVLDWAVAKCEGENSVAACYYDDNNTPLWLDEAHEPEWKPSTDWAQGGPIIEREGISLEFSNGDWFAKYETSAIQYFSYSPLLSAMRCYVASKLGEEVEIPEEVSA